MYVSFMQYVHLIGTHHVGHNVGHHVGHHVSHLVNLNFGHLAQALQYRIWDLGPSSRKLNKGKTTMPATMLATSSTT